MVVKLDGKSLSIDKLVSVARGGDPVEVADDAWARIKKCRAMLDDKVQKREVMYGVTTGIGELSEVVLTPEQTQEFQRYLVYSHSAGCGEPCDQDDIRGAMVGRVNVHCKGLSGLRPVVVETFVNMVNKGVTPVVFQHGSVGACGDLSPMSQLALVLLGEGEAYYKGKRMSGKEAMAAAGIPTIVFEARDGLAAINGSILITAMGSLQLADMDRWLKTQEIVASMTFQVLNVNMLCVDERLHKARGFDGAIKCAENLRRLCDGAEMLVPGKIGKKKVQNAYSLRSTPQVIGSAKDAFVWARSMFEIELNGAGDNPLFFPDDNEVVTGANFQGTPMAFALELSGTALTTSCVLSERRLNRMMHPFLNEGLPAFLVHGAGMFSGLTTAIKTKQILRNAWYVLAIELIAACQAMDQRRPLKGSQVAEAVYEEIRKHVAFMKEDRPMQYEINAVAELIKSGKILAIGENLAGKLA
jgi:histidine ammonia-lyase